mmetsp:Transcript_103197/g.296156  ORF Transcript_103197/g.296156 Transcript_103197/m.296156 type:complete len:204 (+) Transcript_103197:116-727(+)
MVPRISRTFCRSTPETPNVLMSALSNSARERPSLGSEAQNSNHVWRLSARRSGGRPRPSARRSSRKFSTIHCKRPPSAQNASSVIPSALPPSESACHWFHQPDFSAPSASPSPGGGTTMPSSVVPPTPRARLSRSASKGRTASRARTTSSRSSRPLQELSTMWNQARGPRSTFGNAFATQPQGALARQSGQLPPNRWAQRRQK